MSRSPKSRTDRPTCTKGDRTREQLISTIVDLVNARPLDAIRIADICEPSGLAASSFYFHFKGRDDAYEQIAVETVRELFEEALGLPPAPELLDEVTGLLDVFHRAALKRRARIKAFFHILNARRNPEVRKVWQGLHGQLVARLQARIDAEKAAGAEPVFASSAVLAQYLVGALERFYDDVFVLTMDKDLPALAGSREVFVLQQARMWCLLVRGQT
jgi:AcrR family transcriptional regulator